MFGSHIVDWSMMIAIHMKLSQVTVASDDMIHWPLPNVSYHQKCRAIICTVSDHHTRWTTKPILWLRSWNLDRFKVRTQVHCQCVFFVSDVLNTFAIYPQLQCVYIEICSFTKKEFISIRQLVVQSQVDSIRCVWLAGVKHVTVMRSPNTG